MVELDCIDSAIVYSLEGLFQKSPHDGTMFGSLESF